MRIKCSQCGKATTKKIGNHKYTESGLNNVYLQNISLHECSCGVSYPSIFKLSRLNELIALALVEKPALLTGNEIKFLRKNLYMPSKLFANKLGVGKTTLSKWENDVQNHSEGNDRLIRAIYIIEKGIKLEEQLRIQKHLGYCLLKNSDSEYVIIAEKVEDDYVIRYRPVIQSRAEPSNLINVFTTWIYQSITASGTILGFLSHEEIRPTYTQHNLYIIGDCSSRISEETKIYAPQTTEI
jgi:putative transcriptional regulator